nr:hypothetical protein [Escherichia coli]
MDGYSESSYSATPRFAAARLPWFFDELLELYTRYCEVTNWELSNRVIYAFSVDYEPRKNGQTWASHLCYWVQFSPKDKLSFSVREAVDEIAKAAAEQR